MPGAISTGDTLSFDSLLWTGPQLLRGSSTAAVDIFFEGEVAEGRERSGGICCFCTWHATVLWLSVRVCSLCVARAAFVSLMLHSFTGPRTWTGQQYCIWWSDSPGTVLHLTPFMSGPINEFKAGSPAGGFTVLLRGRNGRLPQALWQ